jgi:putative hydrolase of the HAD superfamily
MSLFDGPVDAVLLDAGGVLMLPSAAAIERALAPFGVTCDDDLCHRVHYESMREVDRMGQPDWLAIDRRLCRSVGVPEDRLDDAVGRVDEVYRTEPWVPVAGAAEAMVALQAAGYVLAIVSNASGTVEQQLLGHRICSVDSDEIARVEVVVDSQIVGIEKPDPRIFDFALDAIGVGASRCIYIGDSVHFDVEGARAAGIRPVHVDPYVLCPERDHPHVVSVAALAEDLLARGPRPATAR